MTLEYATPDIHTATHNVLLYGGSGNGKTVGACSAPGPVLLVNADGKDASRYAHSIYGDKLKEVTIDGSNASQVLDDVYLTLKEGTNFKTVVLDTMGEIYQALLDQWSNNGKISLPMRGDASTKIERLVRSLRDLPINVVLVAQEQIEDSEADGQKQRITMPLIGPRTGLLWSKVMEAMSTVGYVGVLPSENDDADPEWVAQFIEAGGRKAKSRHMGILGEWRKLDLTEWFRTVDKTLADGAGKKKEEKSK